ncbi:putative metal ion transmembrane transporter protein [Chaetomium sp. MPI-SDFR-AT-0129]|nr:putative metal ion transmembrane transporter protein [Chaetomium sp. MPI-SDFR-AT-0129]
MFRHNTVLLLTAAYWGVLATALATVTPTPTEAHSVPVASSFTAVSECHLHGSAVYCVAGTAEFEVHASATATQDVPPAFTGCHSHGAETFCLDPNGDEVELHPAGEEEHGEHEGHDHESSGENCHFHAGVEHCTGGHAHEACELVQRDYNVSLRVGLLFVMLVTSSIGVFVPILVASYVSPSHAVFTILRQFGTGVIISTAFVHLYTHANLMFQNECLGTLAYESTASAILMAGLFLSFLIEYAGNRLVQWHQGKAGSASVESVSSGNVHDSTPAARTGMVNIMVMEAGIIFHSLLIGLTLVVSGDSFFLTLFAVIVFHQMFEGLALGTRIAALGRASPTATLDNSSSTDSNDKTTTVHNVTSSTSSTVTIAKKLLLAFPFALITPLGMAIGIGVLHRFNGNDPATVIALGTLDALSAGILVWVGVVEMWAHDWMMAGGEMTRAGAARTALGLGALVVGMGVMSLLGKWA